MKAHQAEHAVATMARLLEVSTSGYYAWLSRPDSQRTIDDRELSERIRHHHAESRGTYGARRIHADLLAEGREVGVKRVARLMRNAGLEGVSRRRKGKTTRQDRASAAAPDLLERDFTATWPDQKWVADITYVPTWQGFTYLAIVLDVWSRRIVGWATAPTLHTQVVLDALNMAVFRRRPDAVIHHSDKGCQYTSIAFGQRCAETGTTPSTGSTGDCFDNAMAESFFASLECELIDRTRFATRHEADLAVIDYIEGFYNTRRRHSALDYRSPIDYENDASSEAA
ncbi:Mobile element protein [Euzebya pacifica]|uniref:Mobile element protein n=2 Tax=Euzebya pacifica TaxID=1608957 RepID=A0A346XWY5_9ACTN|nr:Mobile element protein [Euzebya pacifica]